MKNLLIISVLFLSSLISFAQPGVASIEPANLIKDAENRTVTMQNGTVKNTPIVAYWQLHGSGFQPMSSVAAGAFYLQYSTLPQYSVVVLAVNTDSSALMAPVNLPDRSQIQNFEACFIDRSLQSPNYSNCDLVFTLFRVKDNSCPPEALATLVSEPSGQNPNCPIKCLTLGLDANLPQNLVDNKNYFYYVLAKSKDPVGVIGAAPQQCGNWAQAFLGVRGVGIEYVRK